MNDKKTNPIRVVIIFALVLTLIGGYRIFFLKAPAYKTTKVTRGIIEQTVMASGEVKSLNQVDLKFQTGGKLVWVGVKEGDTVKKWQVIASLDQRTVERNIKKKFLAYMNERWDFEQTQDDYKTRKERYLLTDAEKRILEKAQFDLDSVVADYEIAVLAKEQAVLVSPIAGIITRLDTAVAGVNVTATDTVTIADPSTMIFQANIEEIDIGKIKIGQVATVSLDAYPEEKFKSEVIKIGFASAVTTGGGTAFPIEVSLPPKANQKFKVGLNGDIEVGIETKENILVIPSEALFSQDNKTYVWKMVKKKPAKIEISTGLVNEEMTEVTSGLGDNDIIISENVGAVK